VHITILDGAGQMVVTDIPSCSRTCSTCAPTVCPPIFCAAQAPPAQEELTWDGRSAAPSTCGNDLLCYAPAFVPAGRYVARMCATPGTLTPTAGGPPTACTATAPEECADVPFDLPGPSPIVGAVP
jgi:hypothetical protein